MVYLVQKSPRNFESYSKGTVGKTTKNGLAANVLMEGTGSQRQVIDIGMTVQKHHEIITYLLEAHALSGCDTVSHLHGSL